MAERVQTEERALGGQIARGNCYYCSRKMILLG